MFHKTVKKRTLHHSPNISLHVIESSEQLLKTKSRTRLLTTIAESSGMEASLYHDLCSQLISSLAAHCQSLPETMNTYYALPGGMIDHVLNRTEAAITLFYQFLQQGERGVFSKEQQLWVYTLLSAGLLQGIGKLYLDFKIEIFDNERQFVSLWNPMVEPFGKPKAFFSYEFEGEVNDSFRRRVNTALAHYLMPTKGLAWLSSKPEVYAVWLALLHEDFESAGTLGAILSRANDLSIQQFWHDFLVNHAQSSFINSKQTGTFSKPDSLLDKEQLMGAEFLAWLHKALKDGQIMLNKAPVFMVPGGLLMLPEVFLMFIREHASYKNWQAVQKGFLSLGLHRADGEGPLTHNTQNEVNKQTILVETLAILPDHVTVYDVATNQDIVTSAVDCIHSMQTISDVNYQSIFVEKNALNHLAINGEWVSLESPRVNPSPHLGSHHRG